MAAASANWAWRRQSCRLSGKKADFTQTFPRRLVVFGCGTGRRRVTTAVAKIGTNAVECIAGANINTMGHDGGWRDALMRMAEKNYESDRLLCQHLGLQSQQCSGLVHCSRFLSFCERDL